MSLTSALASSRRVAGMDMMKLSTLVWVAFVLFSVMHALRLGNGNKTPRSGAVVNRDHAEVPHSSPDGNVAEDVASEFGRSLCFGALQVECAAYRDQPH